MGVNDVLVKLRAERLSVEELLAPLREQVKELNRQIDNIAGRRVAELDAQIATLVEMVDTGLDVHPDLRK